MKLILPSCNLLQIVSSFFFYVETKSFDLVYAIIGSTIYVQDVEWLL